MLVPILSVAVGILLCVNALFLVLVLRLLVSVRDVEGGIHKVLSVTVEKFTEVSKEFDVQRDKIKHLQGFESLAKHLFSTILNADIKEISTEEVN